MGKTVKRMRRTKRGGSRTLRRKRTKHSRKRSKQRGGFWSPLQVLTALIVFSLGGAATSEKARRAYMRILRRILRWLDISSNSPENQMIREMRSIAERATVSPERYEEAFKKKIGLINPEVLKKETSDSKKLNKYARKTLLRTILESKRETESE